MQNLASKLVKIMSECALIHKNGVNSFHNYRYVMASDLMEKVNAALVKYDVASVVNSEIIDMRDSVSKSGSTEHLVTIRTKVTLIDCASSETLTIEGLGSGADVADKAVAKALTSSLKYAYMMTLNIATGDDPEADVETDRRNAPQATAPPVSEPHIHIQDEGEAQCSICGTPLTKAVLRFSLSKYHRKLCISCQSKAQQNKKPA